MTHRNYHELRATQEAGGKFLCVGLDTDLAKLPESCKGRGAQETLFAFNRAIIDATKDIAGSYKPNTAFYEAHGEEGVAALRETIAYLHEQAPEIPVILDAKRADIGNTNAGYIASSFEYFGADAVTVHPYLGSEALAPFLERKEKGVFVLCRTSNEGAGEVQDMLVDGEPLYRRIARLVSEKWNTNGNCGLVVGATYPKELAEVRSTVGEMPILVPGVGAQGGELESSVRAARSARDGDCIISLSRAILYASQGEDFAEAARREARTLDDAIRKAIQ